MPFIIPNAIDTTSGNKYSALDQAEPDSIDFEVLGNNNSGVISGGTVSPTTVQGSAVAVEGGTIVVNGNVYVLSPNSYLALPSPPSTLRFDLVVARVSGGTASPVCLYGTESATNPALPKSKSRVVSTAGLNVLSYFNPDTDVVLASLYRFGSNNVTAAEIVDKRKNIQTPIPFRGSTSPVESAGQVGDFYLQTGSLGIGSSGVYVKRTDTQWVELANIQADPGVPIGTVIQWVAKTKVPNLAVWTLCDGRYIDPVEMPGLYNVIEYDFGKETTSSRFKLPDLRGTYLAGVPESGSAGTKVNEGSSGQVTLTLANMPKHDHEINHGHGQITTELSGAHTHTFNNNWWRDNFSGSGGGVAPGPLPGGTYANWSKMNITKSGDHEHTFEVETSSDLRSQFTGEQTPTPIDVRPQTMYVRYYIRYA